MMKGQKERETENEAATVPRSVHIKIRQAFYEGVASICLRAAWEHLDAFRKKKLTNRYFRGQFRDRKMVPLADIAEKLGRNTGEISRWFQNRSPDWANLLMVMTTLDADWPHLQLPPKEDRKFAGLKRAFRFIRQHVLEQPSLELEPSDLVFLAELGSEPQWVFVRRLPDLRTKALLRVSQRSGISAGELDRIDLSWGDALVYWLTTYGADMDNNIWR